MRVVVLNADGLPGQKVAALLRGRGHEVLGATAATGINTLTGEGLDRAFCDAQIVVDIASREICPDAADPQCILQACRNIVSAASAARIRHHLALSEVGTGRLPQSDYFCAQSARERLIETSLVPHTILRSTQFFETIDRIDRSCVSPRHIRVAPACVQPVHSDEVAAALCDIAASQPRNATLEMAGPQRLRLDDVIRLFLDATRSPRRVVTDARAAYFGALIEAEELLPEEEAIIGATRFHDWLHHTTTALTQRSLAP